MTLRLECRAYALARTEGSDFATNCDGVWFDQAPWVVALRDFESQSEILSFVARERYGIAMSKAWIRWSGLRWGGMATVLALALVAGCKTQETQPAQLTRSATAAVVGSPVARATVETVSTRASSLESASDGTFSAPSGPTPTLPPRLAISAAAVETQPTKTKYAILVSVDGLAPRFLEELLRQGKTPTFAALQKLAAWTHNARTDKTFTITLPNHTSMVTGLPVSPSPGFAAHRAHRYTENIDPLPGATLHPLRDQAHTYTPSMFDVAHDHGLTTAMYASKTKFSIYSQTYNDAGGPDEVGADNGRKKIDTVVIDMDVAALVAKLVNQLEHNPPNLTFLHLGTPDAMGHGGGLGHPPYMAAVQQVDALLGHLLSTLQNGKLANKTALIITADHGGTGNHHYDVADIHNFQIPFYVVAPGVAPGDAYAAFKARFAPGPINLDYNAPKQPLRNGDSGNVALALLGLPQIPDSVIQSAGLVFE